MLIRSLWRCAARKIFQRLPILERWGSKQMEKIVQDVANIVEHSRIRSLSAVVEDRTSADRELRVQAPASSTRIVGRIGKRQVVEKSRV